MRDLQDGIVESTFLTPAEFRRYIELFNQRREIGYASFTVDAFLGRVTIDEAAISAHYESNQARYQTTETVDLEYVELALADIASTVDVSDDALRKAYDEERERFQTTEERHARHILIAIDKGDEEAARAKAAAIAERLRKGEDFAKLATEVSADAGTKAQGGDLGWMTPREAPFEDALFGMQLGEISDPVRSDFGFHVIRLDEIRPATVRPFEAVRDELAGDLRTRRAEKLFYDRANQLDDRSFDAYNELATVATELKLPLKTLANFPRTGDASGIRQQRPCGASGVRRADRRQRPQQLARRAGGRPRARAARDAHTCIDGQAARTGARSDPRRPKRARAEELAEQASQAFLTAIQAPNADPAALAAQQNGSWNAPAWVERTNANVPTEVLAAAFGLPKPAQGQVTREHVALANGSHAVLALSNVQAGAPDSIPQGERDQRQRQLADQSAYSELTGYVGTLREQATVRIPQDVIEPQQY